MLLSACSKQAPCRVEGQVRDRATAVPIAKAGVSVGGASTATGADGRFVATATQCRELRVTATGYVAATQPIVEGGSVIVELGAIEAVSKVGHLKINGSGR